MVCPNCGCECDENQMFCTKCGTKINSFENDITLSPIDKTEEDLGGITIESGKEDTGKVIALAESVDNKDNDKIFNDMEEVHPKQKKSKPKISKPNYESTSARVSNSYTKKPLSKKKVIFVIIITFVLILAAVFSTYEIKKSIMTKKYNSYYSQAEGFYKSKNYEYARTQYINASNSAFTKGQKRQSYEMVYKVDGLLGGYDQEQIKYLELLIDVDDSNIDYYKDLIILYQNNDMTSQIDSLIASAPAKFQNELAKFEGTIPVASIPGGEYNKPLEITLTASEGVKIYYTLDGSSPIDNSSKKEYTGPIKLSTEGTTTIRAYSVDKNKKESKEMSEQYVLSFKKVNAPKVEPDSGDFSSKGEIVVTADSDCTVYYTTDGKMPTEKSNKYTKPIKLDKANSVYYFIAIDSEGVTSDVVTRAYNYSPNRISYNSAVEGLKNSLISSGKLENSNMEFKNGDIAYIDYVSLEKISDDEYYIVRYEVTDKKGKNISSEVYAISCENGTVSPAKSSGGSYSLSGSDSNVTDDNNGED